VQEALLAAYRHIHQFRGQSQMTTWLTTIVRNCALMQLRKRPRQIHLPLDKQTGGENKDFVWERLADTRPSLEEEFRNLELIARLHKCAERLSPTLNSFFGSSRDWVNASLSFISDPVMVVRGVNAPMPTILPRGLWRAEQDFVWRSEICRNCSYGFRR
jgi:hypothetical protein